ncbi:Ribosomal RNA small subunit methyltransferase D [Zhongshania aliphaticivorans]|uniref:Ribosomal RNA small subunit methyltransferase D n=1 Tax=Zhongshania aliphaticivorans TaxID=1470434 RepID=A0A5S9MTE3_9GAMM|nr:16S rRNA (guanine(966)-N(2))-methyltransferase RsmD [Zhongshania aliphaticivorans]CAA0080142.1 Ribosomal RNA small subunit methyltransferase D [Zhongshania aliphaticivorans]CAA0085859.1 Ribosomal RNA small subunit methyltransferase D [Zhongshania aliphaticivorans]
MPKPQQGHIASQRQAGTLRIIGGQWRSRKLQFHSAEGLRPTSDRIRETLFNWLGPHLHGARCLDLFAGSGALGLEALSRYAAHCDFVDTEANSCQQIRKHIATLHCQNAKVHCQTAIAFLENHAFNYDIIFLDPPFHKDLLAPTVEALASKNLVNGTLIYLETGRDEALPALPPQWQIIKDKQAGQVSYRLIEVIL